MQAIRAFVGHSFSDQDKTLVGIFLEHFQNLAKAYPQFSWDHAEEAEPLPLSKKVLAKIEGKNVFVGICTKNERAVRDAALSPSFFDRSVLRAKATDFQWKASDWIVQEIGLAVGRRMSVIIFLEEEVREPGGLHGDIEYIRFSRFTPHASFDKFLQMLVSLTPKEQGGAEAETKGSAQTNTPEVTEPAGNDWEPAADWTEEKYESAMVRMIVDKNDLGLDTVSIAFRASRYAQGDAAEEWEARVEWLRLLFRQKADFEKLKRLAQSKPENSKLNYYLGYAYSQLGEWESAAKALSYAASIAEKNEDKISYQADAALQYVAGDKIDVATCMFEKLKADAASEPGLQQLLLTDLLIFAKRLKEDSFELAVMEQMVALSPADISLRFKLAYKHSTMENKDMAFHHYTKIPGPQRDATTWNNLGVSFSDFDMSVKGVNAYLVSEGQGETLAMANIGYKLLNAGFLEEAKKRVTKAIESHDYHNNINDLLKRLREIPEEENKKQIEVLEKVRPKVSFYRELGNAVLAASPAKIAENWSSPDGILKAELAGAMVKFSGVEEREANALFGALAGSGTAFSRKVVHRTTITARLRGNMMIGEVKRSRDGEQPSLASELLNIKVVLAMYFSSDRSEIHVMESYGSAAPQFYALKAVQHPS